MSTKQCVYKLRGIRTELLITDFGSALFISVNQLQKLGTLLYVPIDKMQPIENAAEDKIPPKIHTLLGKDDEYSHLFARVLIDIIPIHQKALILSLAMKEHNPKDTPYIRQMVTENKIW